METHQCDATAKVTQLEERLAATQMELEELKRRFLKPKSERMKPVRKEAQQAGEAPTAKDGNKNRTLDSRGKLEREVVRRHVPEAQCTCPECGLQMEKVRETQNTIVDRIPERLVHRTVVDEVRACANGHQVTSERPVRATEKSDYGPNLVAHVVVEKVATSTPMYRQSKALERQGLKLHRNSLLDMFHAAAHALRPIWSRLLEQLAESSLVQADETSIRVQAEKHCRNGFMWTFLNAQIVAYCFAAGRSGETPRKVLGKARGNQSILVDAYSGYNALVKLDGWDRAGCQSHGRRKFFDAGEDSPVTLRALEFIRWMYLVEYEAEERNIKGTPEHLELRRTRTLFIFRAFHRWLVEERPRHGPKTPLGKAIRYAIKQRHAWMRIFRNAAIPLDNNASEAALRVVALLRKNALFLGHDESGENHAILLTLVATCQLHGINPERYIADVLLRVQDHPASRLDDLLPQNWKNLYGVATPA